MIKAGKFYSSKATPKPRCTTVIEAKGQTISHKSRCIVILPPASATNDQESDTENVLEQSVHKDRLFEAGGELEVVCSNSKESEEDISVLEPPKIWQKITPPWKKSTDFIQDITFVEIEKLAKEHL